MSPQNPYFAEIAALMGDPARANILALLMDGRARTAKELAFAAGVSAQTTSGHLAKLSQGRLLQSIAQGRFRYFRLAGPQVAAAIEALSVLSAQEPKRLRAHSAAEEPLRAARTCYDHLAGRLGVAILDALLAAQHLAADGDGFGVTPCGAALFAELGIDIEIVARQRRGFARPCLDWSERRPHLAGALGAALAARCFALGWIKHLPQTRAVRLTRSGEVALQALLAIEAPARAA